MSFLKKTPKLPPAKEENKPAQEQTEIESEEQESPEIKMILPYQQELWALIELIKENNALLKELLEFAQKED